MPPTQTHSNTDKTMKSPKSYIIGSRTAISYSMPTKPNQKIQQFILHEQPIDALAYHTLKSKQLKSHAYTNYNSVNLHTHGSLSQYQLQIFKKLIEKHQPDEIIIAQDNDKTGRYHSLQYTQAFSKPSDQLPALKIHILRNEHELGIRIHIPLKETQNYVQKLQPSPLTQALLHDLDKNKQKLQAQSKTKQNQGFQLQNIQASVLLPNTQENLKKLKTYIEQHTTPLVNKLTIEVARTKDFNQDLQTPSRLEQTSKPKTKPQTKPKTQSLEM